MSHTWDAVDHYFSGQGVVLISERDEQGKPKGFIPVGNVPDLKLSINTSSLEHKESHTGQRGTDLRISTEVKVGLSMVMENFIADNLARLSRGTNTVISGSTHTGKLIARLGKIMPLPHIKVSGLTLKKGGTPLTANTDYWLNEEAGSVRFADTINSPAVSDGDELDVEYTYEKQVKVDGMTEGAKEYYLRFEGLNTVDDNSPVVVEVFKFSSDPFKELALISDGVQSFTLEGSVLADTTRSTGSRYFDIKKLQ